jgi:hypothetical protein
MTHLPLNRAKIAAMRLEEDARSIRPVPQHRRLAVRHPLDGLEHAARGHFAIHAQMPPHDGGLQRSMERRLDRNRPAGSAADTRVSTAIARMEGEDVHRHVDSIWRNRDCGSGIGQSVLNALIGSTCIARSAGIRLARMATSERTRGTVTNVTGSRGCTW